VWQPQSRRLWGWPQVQKPAKQVLTPATQAGRKMKKDRERQAEPLCKFGPGGDFVSAWEPKPSERAQVAAKLLDSAVEALAAAFGLKRATHLSCPDEQTDRHTEKQKDAIENGTAHDSTDAASAPAPADDSTFSAEPLLFPDLVRNGIRIKHKPKHRIRASRRAAKKGSAFRIPKQGSLFEGQFPRAKIA
jgi:hypothetical protein